MSLVCNAQNGTSYFDDAANLGLNNNGTININNNHTLVVNSDMRWGTNAAVPSNITLSAATGGNLRFDGTTVWWVAFDAATGTVPALGTRGTNDVKLTDNAGVARGEFLGIWTALGVAPLAAATAMPSRGFLKLRSTASTIADNDVLYFTANAATVTVDSNTGGQRGWVHMVGVQTASLTGGIACMFQVTGDWFELGTVDGSDNQLFQYPVADQCAAMQVETGNGTGVYEWWNNAGPPGAAGGGDPTFKWGGCGAVATDVRGKFFGSTDFGEIEIVRRLNAAVILRVTVRVATVGANLTANHSAGAGNGVGGTLTILSAMTTLDGIPLATNDRILVKDQTTSLQNGIYVYTSSTVLTRATDWNRITNTQYADRTYVNVTAGTIAGGLWYQLRNSTCPDLTGTVAFAKANLQFSMCRVGTTGVLPQAPTYSTNVLTAASNALLALDGVNVLVFGDRVLVKDQASAVENGIYTVTNTGSASSAWTLTRDLAEFSASQQPLPVNAYTNVRDGDTLRGSRWQLTGAVTTVDTTAVNWGRIADSYLGDARVAGAVGTTVLSQYQRTTDLLAATGGGCGGLSFPACRAATTAALTITTATATTLTGTGWLGAIDGISSWTPSPAKDMGDKILVKNQAVAAQNGVYWLQSDNPFVLARVPEFTTASAPAKMGSWCFVYGGTANINTYWQLITQDVVTVGTTSVTFSGSPVTNLSALPAVALASAAVLPHAPTYSAPTLTAGSNAALVVDGVTPAVGTRVLVKDQSDTKQNGVYTVTAVGSGASTWSLTRASDMGAASTHAQGREVAVRTGGLTNGNTKWYLTALVTVDTSTVPWVGAHFTPCVLATVAALFGTPNYSAGVLSATLGANTNTTTPFAGCTVATAAALPNLPGFATQSGNVGGVFTATGVPTRLVVDGYNVAVGDRILVKNESIQARNGIYVVTNSGTGSAQWVLTRATDFTTGVGASGIEANSAAFVTYGATLTNTYWYLTAVCTTVNTTSVTFTQGGLTVDGFVAEAGNRILVKNEANTTRNGMYTVTKAGAAWILTRASDWVAAVQPIARNRFLRVLNGATLSNTYWFLANEVTTVDTTAPTFTQSITASSAVPELIVDGVRVQAEDTVLITGQPLPVQNGLYRCMTNGPAWSLERTDNNVAARAPIPYGSYVRVDARGTALVDCRLSTRTTLPNAPTYSANVLTATTNGTLVVDGLFASSGDRILVKNQLTMSQNGIYVVTTAGTSSSTWNLTRSADFNTDGLPMYVFVGVRSGAVNLNTYWVNAWPVVKVGTSSVFWIAYNIGTTLISNDVQYVLAAEVRNVGTDAFTFNSMRGSACGYRPVTGSRVRIPNVVLSNTVAGTGDYARNRVDWIAAYRFTLGALFNIDLQCCTGHWFINTVAGSSDTLRLTNCAFSDWVKLTGNSNTFTVDGLAVAFVHANGLSSGALAQMPQLYNGNYSLSVTDQLNGGTIRNSRFTRCAPFNTLYLTNCYNLTLTNVQAETFASPTLTYDRSISSTSATLVSACANIVFHQLSSLGSGLTTTNSSYVTIVDLRHADRLCSTTSGSLAVSAWTHSFLGSFLTLDGFAWFGDLPTVQPYANLFSFNTCSNVTVKNIGSASQPLDLGVPLTYNTGTVLTFSGNRDLTLRRCYFRNERTSLVTTASSLVSNVILDTVWCNGNRNVAMYFRNMLQRGCRYNTPVAGVSGLQGRHWLDNWLNDNQGRLILNCCSPTSDTAAQVTLTAHANWIVSTGQVYLPNIGDAVEWTTPYYVLGYTAVYDLVFSEVNPSNYTKTYQMDLNDGVGFRSAVGTGTYDSLTLANLAAWTLSPTLGFKLKIKYAATVFSLTNTVTSLYLGLTSTRPQAEAVVYRNCTYMAATITGLISGCRLYIYNLTTSVLLVNTVVSGTSYALPWMAEYDTGEVLRVRVVYVNGTTAYLPWSTDYLVAVTDPWTLAANLVLDALYNTNAVDGSAVSECTVSGNDVVIAKADNSTSLARVYAFVSYTVFASAIDTWFGAFQRVNDAIFQIDVATADLHLRNAKTDTLTLTGGSLYRSDGTTWLSVSTVGPVNSAGWGFTLHNLTGIECASVQHNSLASVVYV